MDIKLFSMCWYHIRSIFFSTTKRKEEVQEKCSREVALYLIMSASMKGKKPNPSTPIGTHLPDWVAPFCNHTRAEGERWTFAALWRRRHDRVHLARATAWECGAEWTSKTFRCRSHASPQVQLSWICNMATNKQKHLTCCWSPAWPLQIINIAVSWRWWWWWWWYYRIKWIISTSGASGSVHMIINEIEKQTNTAAHVDRKVGILQKFPS